MHTKAVEDYLKAVYEIHREQGQVTTKALAQHLDVAPASVTGMAKKLAEMKLVTHEPYRGISLTSAGLNIALEVIRHHRLIELYLAEALYVPWDRVHEEAEKWEHVLSEDLENRMDEVLGHPTTDPHGAPIPTREGVVRQPQSVLLSQLIPSQSATVAEVSDRDPALLRYLGELGLYPNAQIQVIAVEPFQGSITLLIGDRKHALGHEAAQHILVTHVNDDEPEFTAVQESEA